MTIVRGGTSVAVYRLHEVRFRRKRVDARARRRSDASDGQGQSGLREVISLAERGLLEPLATEYAPLEKINDVYTRLKKGEIRGRAVITP